jgi:hypothetical protein
MITAFLGWRLLRFGSRDQRFGAGAGFVDTDIRVDAKHQKAQAGRSKRTSPDRPAASTYESK